MISARTVSLILTTIWVIVFFITRKKQITSKWYFYLLFIMSTAGIFLDLDKLIYYVTQSYSFLNIALFAILLLLVLIPWMAYDKWLKNTRFVINERYMGLLKLLYVVLFLLSVFCLLYCMPYAIMAISIGAEDIRNSGEGFLLPRSFLTTMATGVATLAPVGLLLFYIGLLDKRLKIYSLGVLLVPLASVVHSMACAGREMYVFLPITFIVLYVAFSKSLSLRQRKLLKRIMILGGAFLAFFFITITKSRFGEFGSDYFISGTWGYLYQQPYVFDQTLQFFDNYKGFSKSLTFIGNIFGAYTQQTEILYRMEWSFGTMYKAFYEMYGYSSLIIGSIIYTAIFTIMAKSCLKKTNTFSTMFNFVIFIWFTISGLFYFRYGAIDAQFILYMMMVLLSPLYPRIVLVYNSGKLC